MNITNLILLVNYLQIIPYQAGWQILKAIRKDDFIVKTHENDEVRQRALLKIIRSS